MTLTSETTRIVLISLKLNHGSTVGGKKRLFSCGARPDTQTFYHCHSTSECDWSQIWSPLNNTLQDVLIRLKRMQGYNALWMPGTDHAGIATWAVVERRLKEEEAAKRVMTWDANSWSIEFGLGNQYEARILGQLKRMGCSCDWERTYSR